LVLKAPEVQARMAELLARLEREPGLRQLYLQDPAGVFQTAVLADHGTVPAAEINRGNRLLFAILSNSAFLDWVAEYEKEVVANAVETTHIDDPEEALRAYLAVVDRTKVHQDIADAVARYADGEMIAALTWKPDAPFLAGNTRVPIQADVAVEVETFVYAVAAVAVLAVAVLVVFAFPNPDREAAVVDRLDISAVAQQLQASLVEQAATVRNAGVLKQFSARNLGATRE
jgi:hypothetical protein